MSGGRRAYLCFRRRSTDGDPDLAPITSLTFMMTDVINNQEIPYGYELVERAIEPRLLANVNTASHPIFLAVHRGEGAPIVDLNVVFRDRATALPLDAVEIVATPSGLNANTNSNTSGLPCYICCTPDVAQLLAPFDEYLNSQNSQGTYSSTAATAKHTHERGIAQTLGLLLTGLYCHSDTVCQAVYKAFGRLPHKNLPSELLDLFFSGVCDSTRLLWCYLPPVTKAAAITFLMESFFNCVGKLSTRVTLKIVDSLVFAWQSGSSGDGRVETLINGLTAIITRMPVRGDASLDAPGQEVCAQLLGKLVSRVGVVHELEHYNIQLTQSPNLACQQLQAKLCDVVNVMTSLSSNEQSEYRGNIMKYEGSGMERTSSEEQQLSNTSFRMQPAAFLASISTGAAEGHPIQHRVIKLDFMRYTIAVIEISERKESSLLFSRRHLTDVAKLQSLGIQLSFAGPSPGVQEFELQDENQRNKLHDDLLNDSLWRELASADSASQTSRSERLKRGVVILDSKGSWRTLNSTRDRIISMDLVASGHVSQVKVQVNSLPPLDSLSVATLGQVSRTNLVAQEQIQRNMLAIVLFVSHLAQTPELRSSAIYDVDPSRKDIPVEAGSGIAEGVPEEAQMRMYGSRLVLHICVSAAHLNLDQSVARPTTLFPSSRKAFVLAFRRFVCPCVVRCSTSAHATISENALKAYGILANHLRKSLVEEIGVLSLHFGVEMLQSPFTSPRKKISIILVIRNSVLSSFSVAMDLFLNYDNAPCHLVGLCGPRRPAVYVDLIRSVCTLAVAKTSDLYHLRIRSKQIEGDNGLLYLLRNLRYEAFRLVTELIQDAHAWICSNTRKAPNPPRDPFDGPREQNAAWLVNFVAKREKLILFRQVTYVCNRGQLKDGIKILREHAASAYSEKNNSLLLPRYYLASIHTH